MLLPLPRTELLSRMTEDGAPGIQLLEAPTGFGKSWLLRRAAPPNAVRLRGDLHGLVDGAVDLSAGVVIDDAHELKTEAIERLARFIEDAPFTQRLIIAGRILPSSIHQVTRLVDGLTLDATALALTTDEIVAVVDDLSPSIAEQIIGSAEGGVHVVVTAIEHWHQHPGSDPVAIVGQLMRAASATAMQQLDTAEKALVGLLARMPSIDEALLAALGGPRFLKHVLAAGVPLRRQVTGDIDIVGAAAFRAHDIDPAVAARLATALVDRDRPIDAVNLLLDAGAHDRAAKLLRDLPESLARSAEPRQLLAAMSRMGALVESDPALLLLRANASAWIGRVDSAFEDVDLASEKAESADPVVRRRVAVAAAARALYTGRPERAAELATAALQGLGPAEERTYARAHEILAETAERRENRVELLRAAEWFRTAAAAWESCGEDANARVCRSNLAMAALVPLGRFDQALATLGALLAVPSLSEAERSWLLACEGFVLVDANRLDSAESRFERVSDLGYVQDNPRMTALAAWGKAMIAARRNDLEGLFRWSAAAENTALGDFDDILGVPFLCEMATAHGAVGELDAAERYLRHAESRPAVAHNRVRCARFVLDARRGVIGDVDRQLEVTRPIEWWRVELVSALAAARQGDVETARRLLSAAERDLLGLGFGDFAALGERRAVDALRELLAGDAAQTSAGIAPAPASASSPAGPRSARRTGLRVRVIGGPMAVEGVGAITEIPPGNPQRLVGVVVANRGMASFDQLHEAIWPEGAVEASRTRLRNVLLRLRRGAGEIVARSGSGVRLAGGVVCDLLEFEQLAADALASARNDPDLAGELAEQAVAIADGPIFADFQYEEWAIVARRSAEAKLISLLDLLSVQAEDAGDLPRAQAFAERALRLDRYSDSRYVRLAELLTSQGRSAAALAILEDAAEVARENGAEVPDAAKTRRDELIRRAASG